jgi:hypothetical protein
MLADRIAEAVRFISIQFYTLLINPQRVPRTVTPAHAGVYNFLKLLDPGFCRDDAKHLFRTLYEFIIIKFYAESCRPGYRPFDIRSRMMLTADRTAK